MANRTKKPPVAVLSVELAAGQRDYVLIPDGNFRSADASGRPADAPAWVMNADIAARLLQRVQARNTKMVVDYEHQTLNKEQNGQPAPAAGWIDRASLHYEPGRGIVGTIEWTDRAAQLIASNEYRYLSPVFPYQEGTGEVLSLFHVALTNDAGLDLPAVALSAINDFSTEEEPQVNETLKKLLAALGMAETASEADALGAVADLSAKAKQVDDLEVKVAALSSANPDPSKFAPIAAMQELQTKLAALTASVTGDKVEQLVDKAIADGKLLPVQKDWALELGKSNQAALTTYLEKTPAIAALSGQQSDTVKVGETVVALSATEAKVAQQLGLSNEDYAKSKAQA